MEGYRDFRIPCFMMDLDGLERFLEEKASEGYMLTKFRRLFRAGIFEEVMGRDLHFCVDVYRRVLKKTDLESEDFQEYREMCQRQGWSFVCFYKNLVVFSSDEKQRPLSLRSDNQVTRELLEKMTLRTEMGNLLVHGLELVLWWCFLVMQGRVFTGGFDGWLNDQRSRYMVFVLLLLIVLFLMADTIDFLRFLRALKSGREFPDMESRFGGKFWAVLTLFVMGAAVLWIALPFASQKAERLALLGMTASLALMVYLLFRRIRPRWKMDWIYELGVIVPVLLLLLAYGAVPFMGSRRYLWQDAQPVFNQTEKERAVYSLGLSYDELGWQVEDAVNIYYINQPYQCQRETVIYEDCWEPELWGKGHGYFERRGRYIGTAIAEVESSEQLERYLSIRGLDLEEAQNIDLLEGVSSYLFPDGKTLVSISGNRVVNCFLSPAEERTFDLADDQVSDGIREGLTEIFSVLSFQPAL